MIWLIYILATVGFYSVFWHVTGFVQARWVNYSLRALMLTVIITPWYSNGEGTSLAPALMVVFLDAVTIGIDASGRALMPLLLALLIAECMVSLYWLWEKRKTRK
ncbi:MAG: hypothetical protein OXE78_14860 [Gammaproteobacteria bacterium]|nr:hypothetical protein [Gammaproteobacteria bacterium]